MSSQPRELGRYVVYDRIASGGMAAVHFGRLQAGARFSRTVAIKELHPHLARDPEFTAMFIDEARIAARIQHPNVSIPLDVVVLDDGGEIFLVMEYIHGDTLSRLLRAAATARAPVPVAIAAAIVSGALQGLHAAHEATDERGAPLHVIHRDISPQNIMVGVDGVPRILDFGIAKAMSRSQSTREGQFKGKLAYMAPEQMRPGAIDKRVDLFAAGVVLWEALTGKRLFVGDDPTAIVAAVSQAPIRPPSALNPAVSPAVDQVVLKALARDPARRYQTAREFAADIEARTDVATSLVVGEWVAGVAAKVLAERAAVLKRIDSSSIPSPARPEPGAPELLAGLSAAPPTAPTVAAGPAPPGVLDSNVSGLSRGELVSPAAARRRSPPRRVFVAAAVMAGGLAVLAIGAWQLREGSSDDQPVAAIIPTSEHGVETLAATAGGLPAAVARSATNVASAPAETAAVPSPPIAPAAPPDLLRDGASGATESKASPSSSKADDGAAGSGKSRATGSRKIVSLAKDGARRRKAAASSSAKAHHAGPRKPAQARAGDGPSSCVPPYTIDAAGIRRVKPGCL